MKVFKLNNMIKGWFIGNFEPTLYKNNDFEIGVKSYKAGDYEEHHYHKIATEFTVIVNGKVKMNDEIFEAGDILKIEPYFVTNFEAITDVETVVVKIPCAKNDKYKKL